MSEANREAAITETLKWEGGYSNDAADPGGPTNWGITIADARMYWKKNATATDVRNMPKDIAIDIYRSKYWKTSFYDCDKLNSGVDLVVFDYGVNSGPSRAARALKGAVGGTDTQTINKICDQRMSFLRGLKTFGTFGKGWTRRVAGIRAKALSMVGNKPRTSVPSVAAAGVTVGAGATALAAKHFDILSYWPWGLAALGAVIVGLGIYEYYRFNKQ